MSKIAPRPPEDSIAVSASSSATPSVDRDTGRRQTSRKNVTVACQVCRERRTKCDGGTPCSRCVRTSQNCIYAHDLDGRSQTAIRRKYEKIQVESDTLTELLAAIRGGSDDQVTHIVSLIQSFASLEDLRTAIRPAQTELQRELSASNLDSDRGDADFQRLEEDRLRRIPGRRDVLQIHRLVSLPMHQVSALPWTTVTSDDDLVSHLLSIWLVWDKPWFNLLDHELLIRAMQMRQVQSIYCSPFLVNCILASACPYSDWNEVRTRHGAFSTLMLRFCGEAKTLMESDVARGPTLPTIQGLVYLSQLTCMNGQSRLTYQYLAQAIDMAQELARSPPPMSLMGDLAAIDRYNQAVDLTCWGVFNMSTSTFSALLRPQTMKVPRRHKPSVLGTTEEALRWRPYPRNGEVTPTYGLELVLLHCHVATFEADLTRLMYDADVAEQIARQNLENEVLALHEAISAKLADVPTFLKPLSGANAPILTHYLWYCCVKLRIFAFLKQASKGASTNVQHMAQESSVEVALEVARICKLHMTKYSAAPLANIFTQGVSSALYTLLELPNHAAHGVAITDLFICLRSLSRRWPMSMILLRMVQLDVQNLRIKAHPEVERLLDDFEREDWNQREIRPINDIFPDPEGITGHGIDRSDLRAFLDQATSTDLDVVLEGD